MLNRRINSCRASMATSGLIRLNIFSRRSGSMAARSRTSLSRAFHFEYLPKPMPIARSAEMTQTVMSVAVTRSIKSAKSAAGNLTNTLLFSEQSSSRRGKAFDAYVGHAVRHGTEFDLTETGMRFFRCASAENSSLLCVLALR
jgi:hypothetical protein